MVNRAKFNPQIRPLIERAIGIMASEQGLTATCGVIQRAIWKVKAPSKISALLALAIDRATRGAVIVSSLLPDLWAAPPLIAILRELD